MMCQSRKGCYVTGRAATMRFQVMTTVPSYDGMLIDGNLRAFTKVIERCERNQAEAAQWAF